MTNPADPSQLLPLARAAAELQVHSSTLRAWVRRGCPVARRGSRGRALASLFDAAAVRAWRRGSLPGAGSAVRALAADIPELVATAIDQAFLRVEGPHKREMAGSLTATWYLVATSTLDYLRHFDASVPDVQALPAKIARLHAISADFDKVRLSNFK